MDKTNSKQLGINIKKKWITKPLKENKGKISIEDGNVKLRKVKKNNDHSQDLKDNGLLVFQ